MIVLPPGRFSTTTGWAQRSCSFWPTARAIRSVGPPVGNGTTMRTGLDGNVCAAANGIAANESTIVNAALRESKTMGVLFCPVSMHYGVRPSAFASRSQRSTSRFRNTALAAGVCAKVSMPRSIMRR